MIPHEIEQLSSRPAAETFPIDVYRAFHVSPRTPTAPSAVSRQGRSDIEVRPYRGRTQRPGAYDTAVSGIAGCGEWSERRCVCISPSCNAAYSAHFRFSPRHLNGQYMEDGGQRCHRRGRARAGRSVRSGRMPDRTAKEIDSNGALSEADGRAGTEALFAEVDLAGLTTGGLVSRLCRDYPSACAAPLPWRCDGGGCRRARRERAAPARRAWRRRAAVAAPPQRRSAAVESRQPELWLEAATWVEVENRGGGRDPEGGAAQYRKCRHPTMLARRSSPATTPSRRCVTRTS